MRLSIKRLSLAIRITYLQAMLRGYEHDLRGSTLCVNSAEARTTICNEMREIRRQLAALKDEDR
jgi:hypothetical protein